MMYEMMLLKVPEFQAARSMRVSLATPLVETDVRNAIRDIFERYSYLPGLYKAHGHPLAESVALIATARSTGPDGEEGDEPDYLAERSIMAPTLGTVFSLTHRHFYRVAAPEGKLLYKYAAYFNNDDTDRPRLLHWDRAYTDVPKSPIVPDGAAAYVKMLASNIAGRMKKLGLKHKPVRLSPNTRVFLVGKTLVVSLGPAHTVLFSDEPLIQDRHEGEEVDYADY